MVTVPCFSEGIFPAYDPLPYGVVKSLV